MADYYIEFGIEMVEEMRDLCVILMDPKLRSFCFKDDPLEFIYIGSAVFVIV